MAAEDAIQVHPLVLMNIADHYTRTVAQTKQAQGEIRVIGLLFGVQKGRNVEIMNSFEVNATINAVGVVSMDEKQMQVMESDIKLYKDVYSTMECLGWYSSGAQPYARDLEFHRDRITKYNESPLYLLVDAGMRGGQGALPLTIYQAQVRIVANQPTTELTPAGFKINADEAERVSIDHIAKELAGQGGTGSVVGPAYAAVRDAMTSLNQRIKLIVRYLEDVRSGATRQDDDALRAIKTLCNRLPAMDSQQFSQDFNMELADGVLTTYLATVTKASTELSDLMGKFEMSNLNPEASLGGGGMGRRRGPMFGAGGGAFFKRRGRRGGGGGALGGLFSKLGDMFM